MTYSIGFRAPDAVSTFESFALELERLGSGVPRYRDPDLELDRHRAEITDAEIGRFRALTVEMLQQSDDLWRDAVGKMLSDSSAGEAAPRDQPVFVSDLLAGSWIRHPETRMFFHRSAEEIRFYYNGRQRQLPNRSEVIEHLQHLCERREWPADLIERCIGIEPLEALLVELATNGAIIPAND